MEIKFVEVIMRKKKKLEIFVHPALVLLLNNFYLYLEFRNVFQNIYHEEMEGFV